MADTGEVAFDVFAPDGKFVETLRNGQFRKKKRELEGKGFKIKSVRITHQWQSNYGNHNSDGDHSGYDNGDGFELNSFDTLKDIGLEDTETEDDVVDNESTNEKGNEENINTY